MERVTVTSMEALMNSSVNYLITKKVKCDLTFFFIFNDLSAIEHGSIILHCGNPDTSASIK